MEAEISMAAVFSAVRPSRLARVRMPNPPERTNGAKEMPIFQHFGSISQLCAVSRMIPPEIISPPMKAMLHNSHFRSVPASSCFR